MSRRLPSSVRRSRCWAAEVVPSPHRKLSACPSFLPSRDLRRLRSVGTHQQQMEGGSTGSRSSSMESWAISPGETTLSYAYALLAPSDAVEERRSGVGVRWRACISVLAALAVVVLVLASALVAGDVVADMPPLAETARSRGRDAGVSKRTSGAADDEMGFLGADGFLWSNAMLQWQRTGFHFQPKNWMNGAL